MLGAGTFAQGAAAIMYHGPAFLIPALHDQHGLSLAEAGLVAAAPTVGVMLSLVGWGWVTDRYGERFSLLVGLGVGTVAGMVSALSGNIVAMSLALLVAGAAAASTNAASGRVVVGWFPPRRRGLAMGIRQMAQPAGVGFAAITMAVLADRHGVQAALWVPVVLCAIATAVVAVVVLDPPRPTQTASAIANPYRGDRFLVRLHGVSVLLVVPQFVVWTFTLVWLVQERGWSPGAAGTLVACAQLAGALGRIAAGALSDALGRRMAPLRSVALTAAATMGLLGVTTGLDWALAVPVAVFATVVTVADNGLAFTAVAERAGPFWSGRALGLQNTSQFLVASVVPPAAGLAVAHVGYAVVFGAATLFPLVATPLVPVDGERDLR